MDYEKKYKEALELARVAAFNGHQSLMEGIFPELKESEDEKIRKEIIEHCRNTRCVTEERAERIAKWIAWLEKLGEQKPADKVEPFDKYEGLTDFERTLADICIGWIGEELGWKQYIKDNADVLLRIAVEKFNSVQDAPFEQKPAELNEDNNSIISDLLDYFDEDKCLKHEVNDIVKWLKTIKPQPKGWSDNEIKMFDNLITYLDGRKDLLEEIKRTYIDWLKSIKSRVKPKQEWSEEDQNALEDVREAVVHYWGGDSQDILLYWLKSIKQRIKKEAV